MKNKWLTIYIASVVVSIFLLIPSISAASPYSGAWEPNDTDIFTIEVTPGSNSNYYFYLYDWGDTPSIGNDLLVLQDGTYSTSVVYFTEISGTWYAGLSENSTTLDLGADKWFGFYFYDSNTPTLYNISYDLTSQGSDSYKLIDNQSGDNNTDMVVVVHDADPIPIPGAVWIFGSGLIGLVGIRRKFKS